MSKKADLILLQILTQTAGQVRRDISAVFIDTHYKPSNPVEAGNFTIGVLCLT